MEITTTKHANVTNTVGELTYTGELWLNKDNKVYNGSIYVSRKVDDTDQRVAECNVITQNPSHMGIGAINQEVPIVSVRVYASELLVKVTTDFSGMVSELEAKAEKNEL